MPAPPFSLSLSPVNVPVPVPALPLALLLLSLASLSCSSSPSTPAPAACTPTPVDLSCSPLYEPTYAQVFQRTLLPTCGKSGSSCHAEGRQGGLAFLDADESYRLLVDETRTVLPGDAACSSVVARITATSGKVRMPPGASLDPAEQCSIIRWIQDGAKR